MYCDFIINDFVNWLIFSCDSKELLTKHLHSLSYIFALALSNNAFLKLSRYVVHIYVLLLAKYSQYMKGHTRSNTYSKALTKTIY